MLLNKPLLYLFGVVYFPLFLDFSGLALEYILTSIIVILMSIEVITARNVQLPSFFFAFVFLFLTEISLLRSVNLTITRDIVELIKPIMFFLVFSYGVSIIKDLDGLLDFSKKIILLFLTMVFFGLLESKVDFFNFISSIIYKSSREPVQFKAVLSFISPYTFASILIIPVFYYFSLLIFYKNKSINLVFFLISLLCLVLTQSKTILLSFIFTMLIFPPLLLSKHWLPGRLRIASYYCIFSLIIIFSIPLILMYAEENLRYLYYGFEVIYEQLYTMDMKSIIYSTPSISNRYEQLMDVLLFQDVLPIIGKGIVKDIIYPESFYALYLLRYGVIGIILNFVLIYYFSQYAINIARYLCSVDKKMMCFFLALFAYSLSLPISYLSSAVNDQTRSGFLFYIILGCLYAGNKIVKSK